MRPGCAIRAGAWAAVLSGIPSTLHALATGRDPLEATKAGGSILLSRETRTLPLVLAAVPVHLALSFGWALALEKGRVRGTVPGTMAGLAIAALDLGVIGRRYPRIRALPLAPQVADHIVYGAVVGAVLKRGYSASGSSTSRIVPRRAPGAGT